MGWFRRRKRTSLPPPPQSRPLPSPIYPQQSPESPLACCLKEHALMTSAVREQGEGPKVDDGTDRFRECVNDKGRGG